MLVLDRDGTVLSYNSDHTPAPRPQRGFAELPAQPDGDLAGRVWRLVEFAFDQLGLHSLELRVRDEASEAQFSAEPPLDELDFSSSRYELEYGLDHS